MIDSVEGCCKIKQTEGRSDCVSKEVKCKCVDCRAHRCNTSNALIAPVRWKHKRFQQALEVIRVTSGSRRLLTDDSRHGTRFSQSFSVLWVYVYTVMWAAWNEDDDDDDNYSHFRPLRIGCWVGLSTHTQYWLSTCWRLLAVFWASNKARLFSCECDTPPSLSLSLCPQWTPAFTSRTFDE